MFSAGTTVGSGGDSFMELIGTSKSNEKGFYLGSATSNNIIKTKSHGTLSNGKIINRGGTIALNKNNDYDNSVTIDTIYSDSFGFVTLGTATVKVSLNTSDFSKVGHTHSEYVERGSYTQITSSPNTESKDYELLLTIISKINAIISHMASSD